MDRGVTYHPVCKEHTRWQSGPDKHTNTCKAAFGPKTLWEAYGIIDEATVSPHSSICTIYDQRLTATQPFTEHFPNANVYELITPDLLHQLVKGVFKDLEGEHGKSKADSILDEIDRW